MSSDRELWILRHGKSDWADAGTRDHERPLAPRGIDASRRMGAHLAGIGRSIDATRCSDALRTRETLAFFEEGFGASLDADVLEDLYLATAGALLDQVRALPPAARTALLIGHNPGLEDLARVLVSSGSESAAERLGRGLKTATWVRIGLDGRWRDVGPGAGELLACVRPKDLG